MHPTPLENPAIPLSLRTEAANAALAAVNAAVAYSLHRDLMVATARHVGGKTVYDPKHHEAAIAAGEEQSRAKVSLDAAVQAMSNYLFISIQ